MGLIKAIKKIFSRCIQCSQDLQDELIYLYPSRTRVVKLGYNIIVKSNCCVVFVVKGKVTDVLNEGKHKLDWSILQGTYRRLKVDKHNNCKSFKADLYFVNLRMFNEFVFESNQPFKIKTEIFGKVSANIIGVCGVKITQPNLLLQTLLMDRAYIKSKTAKKFISYYIGNEVCAKIEKSKINFNEMIGSPEPVNQLLKEQMTDALLSVGLRVENIKINCICCLNKKQQNKINEYLSYQKEMSCSSVDEGEGVLLSVNIDNKSESYANENNELKTYINVYHSNSDSQVKICPNCRMQTTGNFCNNCGTRLN